MPKRKILYKKTQIDNSHNKKQKNNETENECPDENTQHDLVTYDENHIYFYDDVNTENILTLIKYIKTLNMKLLLTKTQFEIKYESTINLYIYLHINSNGGYITDALAAIDYIKKSKIPIISIIDGYAASAATLLSILCYKRQMSNYFSMLIHQLSGYSWGTYEQMNDDHENNVYLQNLMKQLYIEHSNGKLNDKKLDNVLKKDILWNPTKCLQNGLVDEIV